jgi:hypothetical protein
MVAAYVTHTQLRAYLPQATTGPADDQLLDAMGARATAMIDTALGWSFAAYGAASSQDVLAPEAPSVYLKLPPYQAGSITSVAGVLFKGTTGETLTTLTDWDELDRFYLYRDLGWSGQQLLGVGGWGSYPWYRVTAIWGYGPVPDDIVELALELAVNMWRSKDKGGFSEIIGADGGGAVRFVAGLNAQQKMILQNIRRKFVEVFH